MAYKIFTNDNNESFLEFCNSASFNQLDDVLKMVTCIQQQDLFNCHSMD